MDEKDTEILQNELAYNLRIIKALWKSKWGNYGKSVIGGCVYDFSSLFRSLEKGKETIRLYIQCQYTYKEKSMSDWANRIEAKTGIPHEYLTGGQRITLGDQFEKKIYPHYMSYLSKRELIYSQIENAVDVYAGETSEDTRNLPHYNNEEIKQYIKMNYNQEEQKEFYEGIKDADAIVTTLKFFEFGLSKEADRIMQVDTAELMQQNEKLCKLVYFIRLRKKYDGISIRTIDDMKMAMEKTKTPQLKQLGKKGLKEYIEMLEKHLNLARSVYTVAIDCGDFEPDKSRKK